MSFLGAGDDHRKKITQRELDRKVYREVANGGDINTRLTQKERRRLKEMLEPAVGGDNSFQRGIDSHELKRIEETIDKHPHTIFSSREKAERVKKALEQEL